MWSLTFKVKELPPLPRKPQVFDKKLKCGLLGSKILKSGPFGLTVGLESHRKHKCVMKEGGERTSQP